MLNVGLVLFKSIEFGMTPITGEKLDISPNTLIHNMIPQVEHPKLDLKVTLERVL